MANNPLGADLLDAALHVLASLDAMAQGAPPGPPDPARLARWRSRVHLDEEGILGGELAVEPARHGMVGSPEIDCAALIPICRARCCLMDVHLTREEVAAANVRWDPATPFMVRQGADGYCVHSDPASRGCGVYTCRPAVCRAYDCRDDKRIWVDFEKRIPAPF